MRITWDAVGALGACLILAVLPLPRRAEGVRIGLFGALMGYVFYDAVRRNHPRQAVPPEPAPPPEVAPVDIGSDNEEDRISAIELLTDFSVLNHLRRTGAVSTPEFEAKKVDILRRV
jgi:hypothetical protein